MVQYQSLRDIEEILKFLEVCIPENFQKFNVIWFQMNARFHRCRHK